MSVKNLTKNIGSLSVAILLSRILGLLRDIVLMNYFGTSYVSDAFQAAFKIPNFLRRLFGEGALSAAFIPLYNEIGIKKDRKAQIDFGLNILSILTMFLSLLSIIGIIFTPIFVKLITPGFDEKTYFLTVKLTRILFPYLFLIGFSSTLISILNSHHKFFIPGLSSAFLNIGMISLPVVFTLFNPESTLEARVIALSIGVLIGGILQTIVNFPLLKKIGYTFKMILDFKSKELLIVWNKFLPGVFGLAVRQINLIADTVLASFLVTGSITALTMGNRLMQLPLGIIGASTGIAVLPYFSKFIVQDKWDELNEHLKFSILSLIFLLLPVTVILIGFGKDIITIVFLRGKFDHKSLIMTYNALVFYSLGIIFYSLNKLFVPIFYAAKDTKTPVIISSFIVVINISLNIILMKFMQLSGLALATSISATIQLLILIHLVRKRFPAIKIEILSDLFKIILLSGITFVVIIIQKRYIHFALLPALLLNLTISVAIYLQGSILLRISIASHITNKIWKIFRKL